MKKKQESDSEGWNQASITSLGSRQGSHIMLIPKSPHYRPIKNKKMSLKSFCGWSSDLNIFIADFSDHSKGRKSMSLNIWKVSDAITRMLRAHLKRSVSSLTGIFQNFIVKKIFPTQGPEPGNRSILSLFLPYITPKNMKIYDF